jgi:bone morphogenetic protein receptor type-1B
VAVKVFFSMFEHSWSRETEIYQTCMLRHENILGYIASDIKGNGCSVNMLLITEYHSHGSLYDYLQQANNPINKTLLYRFLYSISNGLNHLHQEIISTQYKPCIAHRDLKTKNILVKSNLECCIADFGLAVRFNSSINQLDYGASFPKLISTREGTVRYMAPECLNNTINVESIDDFKKADIYQLALIIWELLICYNGNCKHSPPYYEYVTSEPDVKFMQDLVCVQKIRPKIEDKDVNKIILINLLYKSLI